MNLVYRDFKSSTITVNETPNKSDVEELWKSIWEKETKISKKCEGLKKTKKAYSKDVTPKLTK